MFSTCERAQSGLICSESAVYEVLFSCEYIYSCDTYANIARGGNRTFEDQRAATWDHKSLNLAVTSHYKLLRKFQTYFWLIVLKKESIMVLFSCWRHILFPKHPLPHLFSWKLEAFFKVDLLYKQNNCWNEKYPVRSWTFIWLINFANPCNDNNYKSSQTLWTLVIQHKRVIVSVCGH